MFQGQEKILAEIRRPGRAERAIGSISTLPLHPRDGGEPLPLFPLAPSRCTFCAFEASVTPSSRSTLLRGLLLLPRQDSPRFDLLPDGVIDIDEGGRIRQVAMASPGCTLPESHPGCALLPGLVDCHVHFPQTRVMGSASGLLLDWLQRTVFPAEALFADPVHARAVAEEFCSSLISQGTTTAAIFSSSHHDATALLFSELDRRGLRARVGLTLMDRGAPQPLLRAPPLALADCESLIDTWHGRDEGRLTFCLTPRFALSCSPELMRGGALLAEKHGLWIQTHISENQQEIQAVAEMFPDAEDYLSVYRDHGLLTSRTLLAHCIHLSPREWDGVAEASATVAHCPDSNFFLGSGVMPLRHATSRGIAVGLGTDVGAGRTFSLRRVAASAYDASLLAGSPASAQELLWRATAGGAQALGLQGIVGTLSPGEEADIAALPLPPHLPRNDVYDALVFRHDAEGARAVYVRGARIDRRA